ncbi:bifunctional tetrahydrofolate synthase/dihydrofolate synthase [Dyella tabacisoli]|uniref:Dihydrofolate synthase/folylpolyglutamate synthase n=1 Tax=Dyella tabacisoli TaxID=2282381 RepID=A0A369USR3_9GAMM|nr:bifunctional tetrahydrofolate synthase/dihydrofolate synthase [Dyella tabacisoli]RDD83353.1 bifunctional tetrahydrofolate synthase/dihydrofolate synthase [Dyella tabacisoli]
MTRTLAAWLVYQEQVNVRSIELGLDRVRAVWQRMGAPALARRVITVGGTNGKGSTVALLEAMLQAADLRVGCYTSPHLLRYNERVRIDGHDADDAALIASFERIEVARGEIPLTYFEFGTLAALDLFARAELDVAVLEVGLGGRLDAVNIIDADVAVVTTVDLDHMDWLGADRDQIGREKAGIARAGRPVIVGELDPPHGLLDALTAAKARIQRAGVDFLVERQSDSWHWRHRDGLLLSLPNPALAAPVQHANAAAAIAALHALCGMDALIPAQDFSASVTAGLLAARVPARLQLLGGDPALIVDVGHNPQAARALAEWLDAQPAARVHAVYGALADKDVGGIVAALGDRIGHWHLAGLEHDTPRGLTAAALAEQLAQVLPQARFDVYPDVAAALRAARTIARPGERVLAFGSFFVAAAVLAERAG